MARNDGAVLSGNNLASNFRHDLFDRLYHYKREKGFTDGNRRWTV